MAVNESSSSRVPMTLRDFFFADPFFKSSWDDFDQLRQEMGRESTDFWSSVEKDMRSMESRMSSMQSSSSSKFSSSSEKESSSSSSSSSKELESSSKELAPSGDYSPWFFPRRWMLPKLFSDDSMRDSKMRSLNLFQNEDEQVRLQ